MAMTLQINDFFDFEELFKNFKMEILEKQVKGKLVSEDLVKTFQKLRSTIDDLLARVGKRMVAVAQGSHSSSQNENIAKILTLFENLFVGSEEGNPAQLIEFLDQIRTDIISKNDLNSESLSKKISGNSQ
jgi:hypothetical protein